MSEQDTAPTDPDVGSAPGAAPDTDAASEPVEAPETAAPETGAPETVASEMAAPETVASETVAPETGDIVIDAALRDFTAAPADELDAVIERGEQVQQTLQSRLGDLGG